MKRVSLLIVAALFLACGTVQAQMFDITNPGDPLVGIPNDNNWPAAEAPANAIDNQTATKYLSFKTSFIPDQTTGYSGFAVTPSGPKVVVKALNFASANDAVERDPIAFSFWGSNDSIDGPWTLIAEGAIDEFNQTTAYARLTWITKPVEIKSKAAYKHYQLLFTELRARASANSMQIAEVELLSDGSLPGAAGKPSPEDGATDLLRSVAMSWQAGEMAATHDVYFGTNFEDVNTASRTDTKGVLISKDQTDAAFDPEGLLEFGQTYYWRIDEVNAAPDYTIFKGDVWTFAVEPFAYPIENITATASSFQTDMGPENTVNGSGLNENDEHSDVLKDMWMSSGVQPNWIQYEFDKAYRLHELWVWNSNQMIESFIGFGAKTVTIEYSADGETWTTMENAPEFAKATGKTSYTANTIIDFAGITAKFVKLTIDATWGGLTQTGLSEVRFYYVPLQAFKAEPADGATGVSVVTDLAWRPGREATSHTVYVGADSNAVADGSVSGAPVSDPAYTPAGLAYATTYFWKVDETGDTGDQAGDVWSFTTEEFGAVEDFESYNDEDNRIYETWVDGLTNEDSGSQVGYDESPFAEKTIVHSGKQSMPMMYSNSSFTFSEATRTFSPAQDWTARGVKTLAIHFAGAAGNGGQLYVKINNTKIAYDNNQNLSRSVWQAWNIDLSTVGGDLAKVTSLTIGIEGAGAAGTLYVDDVRLYPQTPEVITPADPGKANLMALYTLDGNANDSSGKGNNGTVTGLAEYVAGAVGQALQFNGTTTVVDCGKGASLNLTGAVTITAWIKMDFTAGDRKIAANQDGTTGGYKIGLYTNNKVEFEVRNASNAGTLTRDVAGGTALAQGEWYHVAGVYSQADQFMKTYVFGMLDREMTTTAVLATSTASFKLGRGEEGGTNGYFWLGALDDVAVYNRVLSQEEILWVMGQKTPVAKPF